MRFTGNGDFTVSCAPSAVPVLWPGRVCTSCDMPHDLGRLRKLEGVVRLPPTMSNTSARPGGFWQMERCDGCSEGKAPPSRSLPLGHPSGPTGPSTTGFPRGSKWARMASGSFAFRAWQRYEGTAESSHRPDCRVTTRSSSCAMPVLRRQQTAARKESPERQRWRPLRQTFVPNSRARLPRG